MLLVVYKLYARMHNSIFIYITVCNVMLMYVYTVYVIYVCTCVLQTSYCRLRFDLMCIGPHIQCNVHYTVVCTFVCLQIVWYCPTCTLSYDFAEIYRQLLYLEIYVLSQHKPKSKGTAAWSQIHWFFSQVHIQP